MPAVSKKQSNLFRAADHGATFPMAVDVRASTTHAQRQDFTRTPQAGLPTRAPAPTLAGLSKPTGGQHPHQNLGGYLHPKKAR
jgi:hypothetical protein